jgi:hypothetical protein
MDLGRKRRKIELKNMLEELKVEKEDMVIKRS